MTDAPAPAGFDLLMAFQPIVDMASGRIFAYEALVRGAKGESAESILATVTPERRAEFDHACRMAAIRQACAAGISRTMARLSINFMPDVVKDPIADSEETIRVADECGIAPERLMFEFSDLDRLDPVHLQEIVGAYHKLGFHTAFDDFGGDEQGQGLAMLSRFKPHALKLAPQLVRGLSSSWARRLIVENVVRLAGGLGVAVIAEGVENGTDYSKLRSLGVKYAQGYFLARPEIGRLPQIGNRQAA
ncbi:EAL domain-containing protein [Sphingomonas sp.]|uniref:EAL domain-containing protein n=1 Tax=Sphingomonas sp. TaxID=28214 RepID=UPI0025CDD6E3|nr:EAL domain-containing protein [Sphingomonas sp.]